MKKFNIALLSCCLLGACSFANADCAALSKKYHAPNPASKTMKQIERWVKNRVDNAADAAELRECLLAVAADNPNQASYAGK